MERKDYINDILGREWEMFQKVQNTGGRASCQDDPNSFRIMRGSQFEAWNDAMLASYQQDLIRAEEEGRNLLTEKYGYMMKWTHPEEYRYIQEQLPPVSEEKMQVIELILAIEIKQTKKFREMYPYLGRCGRPLTEAENDGGTSVETYSRGELMTYSLDTLKQYLLHICKLEQSKILFPLKVMKATVLASGYLSLDEAEYMCRKNAEKGRA